MELVTVPRQFTEIEDLHSGVAYPAMPEGAETALVGFSAHWHGRQDAYWIAKAGLIGTCIDLNENRLREMAGMYPAGWQFVPADVYAYAENATHTWDVVSLDPWTSQFQECADHLQMWCDLANRMVVLGTGWATKVEVPAGWRITDFRKRSDYTGGVYWTVLEPA
jgi:hypothetical protein